MKTIHSLLLLTLVLGSRANSADETATRLNQDAAVSLETASVGVQLGGEESDVVVLSLDRSCRAKLLSDRFTIGSDPCAAWGNGKSAHEDPNAQVVFYGQTKDVFADFGLYGATLKRDQSGDTALYGKDITNSEIVDSAAATPPFPSRLSTNCRERQNGSEHKP